MKEKATQIFMMIRCQKNVFDSASRTGKNYYPRVFLEECKQIIKKKKKKMPKYIIKVIYISSNESDKEDSEEKNSNKKNSDE